MYAFICTHSNHSKHSIFVLVYTCACVYECVYMYSCLYVLFVCMCVYVYACICVCMCAQKRSAVIHKSVCLVEQFIFSYDIFTWCVIFELEKDIVTGIKLLYITYLGVDSNTF